MMNVYKLTVMIVDHGNIGPDAAQVELENGRFGNRCISPEVMGIETRDIGEWDDDNPLNYSKKAKREFERLFGK